VRAHNWVCLGALLQNDGQPAWYLPISGRIYFRKSQLPFRSGVAGPKEVFRTKCELAVELLREQARIASGPHLGVFDGGYALKNVVRPLVLPEDGSPRIEFLTRLRHDARLYRLPATERPKGKRGPMAKWGKKLSPPRQGGRWPGDWKKGEAFIRLSAHLLVNISELPTAYEFNRCRPWASPGGGGSCVAGRSVRSGTR
jgi:hypothetical protein